MDLILYIIIYLTISAGNLNGIDFLKDFLIFGLFKYFLQLYIL